MNMVNLVVAYFVALTDHLGSKVFTPTVANPGHELRLFLAVLTGFITLYGMLFAIAIREEMRRVKR